MTTCPDCAAKTTRLSGTIELCATCGVVRSSTVRPFPECVPEQPWHRICLLLDEYRRWHDRHHTARRGPHRCPRCGYDVAHLRSGHCPECGTPVPFMHAPPKAAAMVDETRPVTDALACQLIPPDGAAVEVYDLLRRSGREPAEALASVLALLPAIDGRPLSDEIARAVLPRVQYCQGLYEKLREIGHDPAAALIRILPHTASYAQ